MELNSAVKLSNLNAAILGTLVTCSANSALAQVQCSTEQNPPAVPDNFSINKHAKLFEQANTMIDALPLTPIDREVFKATFMTTQFAPGAPYDLKNNPTYNADQAFGNWFFGFAAALMGYSESNAVKAGAVVQQYQDYTNPHEDAHDDLQRLASEIVNSALTGEGDNPGDSEYIAGGHKYKEVYDEDSEKDENDNSCDPDDDGGDQKPDSVGGANGKASGGWNGINVKAAGWKLGPTRTTSTSITDLPSEDIPEETDDTNDN